MINIQDALLRYDKKMSMYRSLGKRYNKVLYAVYLRFAEGEIYLRTLALRTHIEYICDVQDELLSSLAIKAIQVYNKTLTFLLDEKLALYSYDKLKSIIEQAEDILEVTSLSNVKYMYKRFMGTPAEDSISDYFLEGFWSALIEDDDPENELAAIDDDELIPQALRSITYYLANWNRSREKVLHCGGASAISLLNHLEPDGEVLKGRWVIAHNIMLFDNDTFSAIAARPKNVIYYFSMVKEYDIAIKVIVFQLLRLNSKYDLNVVFKLNNDSDLSHDNFNVPNFASMPMINLPAGRNYQTLNKYISIMRDIGVYDYAKSLKFKGVNIEFI